MTSSPERAAPQRQRRVAGLGEQRQRDAEAPVGGLGAAHRLEDQVDRRPALHDPQRGGDVGQHAGLGGDLEPLDQPASCRTSASIEATESVAGLTPMTASPQP